MKTLGTISQRQPPVRWVSRCAGLILGTWLLTFGAATPLRAEATVQTLGGGRVTADGPDSGFSDGDILQMSQFNTPWGCAVDASGRVYVADRNNGALRRLDLAANRCRTLLTRLNQPVGVAISGTGAVYVLTQGDGSIQKLDRGLATLVTSGLNQPTAMAYDGHNSFFVAQRGGNVVQVGILTGIVSLPLLNGLNQPGGIAFLDSGFIAVSETGGNMIRIWDPRTGKLIQQIGGGSSGFADGLGGRARFSQPVNIAKAPGGSLVVADRGNHRVRLIDTDGFVTTLYGIDPKSWEGPACTTCSPIILPGWYDGSDEFAEAREPVGVAVSNDGNVYATEVYYHLVREVTGANLTGGFDGGVTNIVVLPPTVSPSSGYYPMGRTITVANPNASSLLPSAVYYTTDGTEPTTNNTQVVMDGGVGTFLWNDHEHDLTALRLKAYLGNNVSPIVSGESVAVSNIGVPQDIAAGPGSTAIVPVVINLKTNQQLQSLQFRVQVTPNSTGTPMIPETFDALSTSTNDFIPTFSLATKGTATFQVLPYQLNQTRGLVITFIGTSANLLIKGYGVAAMLAVPIPPTAHIGDGYKIEVLNASGTEDAAQQRVPLVSMPARSLTVTAAHFLVGDSSPALWYNSVQNDDGESLRSGFGDGFLDNSDVNNAFAAALGTRVPYPHTDLFDALDVFPEDTVDAAGGDGIIRFLDWQVLLMRSLGLNSGHWERTWSEGGFRVPQGTAPMASPSVAGERVSAAVPGTVWVRQAALSAQTLEYVVPGSTVDIPMRVQVAPGYELAGLAFRVTLEPQGGTPPLERAVQFIPSADLGAPSQISIPNFQTILCGWPLAPSPSFDPPLRGTTLVGSMRVHVPWAATGGNSYILRFANADGSPDLLTQYDFETHPATLWIQTPASVPADASSDEWKIRFFGSLANSAAADSADPDRDGVPNWLEYQAGTNPMDAQSYLHLQAIRGEGSVVLRWLSAPGKVYRIETTAQLGSAAWTTVAENLAGNGSVQQSVHASTNPHPAFYRIRIQP